MTLQTAGTLCTRDTLAVEPQTPVAHALELMAAKRISSLLVLLRAEPVGILTERDLVRASNKIRNFPELKVRDIMSSPLLTLPASATALAAFQQMRDERIRHFAVLDAQLNLLGLLSLSDLMFNYAALSIAPASTVGELMTQTVITAAPSEPIRQVLGRMAHRELSCVVIADGDRPLGMFSERDIPGLLLAPADHLDRPISTAMTSPQPTISTTTPTITALELMRSRGVRRLIVAADDGTMAGLVTLSLLGRAVAA